MAAKASMKFLLAMVFSQVVLAEPAKEVIPSAFGCTVPEERLRCSLGKSHRESDRVVAPGTVCYDVTAGYTVYCDVDGTWTLQESLGLKPSDKLIRTKRTPLEIAGLVISGVGVLVDLIFGIFDRATADSPPQIRCPGPFRDVAAPLQTYHNFTWEPPQAVDDKEITSGPECSPKSSSTFQEGLNYVQCWAADGNGQLAACTFSVTVDVRRCPAMTWPDDGIVNCSHGSILGSKCTLTCDPGFLALDPASTECTGSDWSVPKFRCKPVQCKQLPNVTNGYITCTTIPVYRTYCQLTCEKGFRLKGTPTILCQEDGTFTAPGRCEDDESPTFPSGCPPDIEKFAAPLGNRTVVNWTAPSVKDNSGSYNLTCSHDISHDFTPGPHTVLYTASDAANNIASCHFQVVIKSISCSAPTFDKSGQDLMMYSCPNRYVLGAQCTVSCKAGYPLVDNATLYCNRDVGVFPPTGSWSTKENLNPECRVTLCPKLEPPQNGAIACDLWGYGQVCTLMCNEKYDIPLQALRIGEFVCGTSTGTWRPTDVVPGCTDVRQPGSMRLPSQLYYYVGNCPDSATQKNITDSFIKILLKSKFFEKCTNVPECRVDRVSVSCGALRRRKRHVFRRSTSNEILVDFIIAAALPSGQSGTQAAPLLQSVLRDVASVLTQEAAAGAFDMTLGALSLTGQDFAPGTPSFSCDGGSMLSPNNTCAGCSPGSFFNTSLSDCQDCPKGHYADAGFSSTCKPCPAHTSTNGTGKLSISECLAQCRPGWVSDTGLEPCQQCQVGSYQTEWGQTLCSQCPPLSSTVQSASTSLDQCLAMDGCDASPCGTHSCVAIPGGWQCQCHGGWTGADCSTPPDLCLQHQCQNGATCVNGLRNYSCVCERGFKGELCSVAIRDGGWSVWSNWTQCSVTCGGGSRSRRRDCDSPSPDPDGLPCAGPSLDSQTCASQDCPSCPQLSRPYGVVWNCSEEVEITSCTAGCRDGLVLPNPRMSVYQCGLLTNYSWTFVSEETPDGFLPECTEPVSPKKIVVVVTTKLALDCSAAVSNRDEAMVKPRIAAKNLDCVTNGKCQEEVTLGACPTSRLRKRSTPDLSNVTITLTSQLTSGRLNLTVNSSIAAGSNQDATSAYFAVLTSLSRTLEQLQNETSRFLTVEVGGQMYPPSPLSFSGNVTCPPGTVPAQVACGECPRGTYQSGVQCVLCGQGSYADSTGSTSCSPCPSGFSTPGLGSTSSSQCRPGYLRDGESEESGENGESGNGHDREVLKVVLPVVFSVLALAVAVPLSIWIWQKYKTKRAVGCSSVDLKVPPGRGNGVPPPAYYAPPYKSSSA